MVSRARSGATGGEQAPAASARGRRRFGPRRPDDEGATLVEFAIIAPLLFMLLFGIFEFGFIFGQHLDVRHGARETARLAAVNYNPDELSEAPAAQAASIIAAGCERMQLANDVSMSFEGIADGAPTSDPEAGDSIRVDVSAPARQITGFFSPILGDLELASDVEIRLEATPTFDTSAQGDC